MKSYSTVFILGLVWGFVLLGVANNSMILSNQQRLFLAKILRLTKLQFAAAV